VLINVERKEFTFTVYGPFGSRILRQRDEISRRFFRHVVSERNRMLFAFISFKPLLESLRRTGKSDETFRRRSVYIASNQKTTPREPALDPAVRYYEEYNPDEYFCGPRASWTCPVLVYCPRVKNGRFPRRIKFSRDSGKDSRKRRTARMFDADGRHPSGS